MEQIPGARRETRLRILLAAASVVVALLCSEAVLRIFYAERLDTQFDERSLLYRYDAVLGWFPEENSTYRFAGANRVITVRNNSRGFRDTEHHPGARPGILVLGDSYVWGYDVEEEERFTERLRENIPGWDIFNLGVSGYGTDQEWLLLKSQYDYYKPRIVLLIFCTDNDFLDNAANMRWGYYKPYFTVKNRGIELRGVPPARSLMYFTRKHELLASSYIVRLLVLTLSPAVVHWEDPRLPVLHPAPENPTFDVIHRINAFLKEKGSRLIVGLEQPHRELEEFLRQERVPFVQLDGVERFVGKGHHWTPTGHAAVSERIYRFLQKEGLLAREGNRGVNREAMSF